MSGPRALISDGLAVLTTQVQRIANAAANADALVHAALTPPPTPASSVGAFIKRVTPMFDESVTARPTQIAVPGTDAGTVTILPALYVVGDSSPSAPDAAAVLMSLTQTASQEAPTHGNTVSNNRIDVVYATVARLVTAQGTRKVKSTTSGAVSAQNVNLEDAPKLTLNIAVGVEGASPAVPSVPSDSGTAWNFPLAQVHLTHPYTGAALTVGQITQAWTRGGTPSRLANSFRRTTPQVVSGSVAAGADLPPGWAGLHRIACVVRWTGAGVITLDSAIDWSRRAIRATFMRSVDHGSNDWREPGNVAVTGGTTYQTNWHFTSSVGTSTQIIDAVPAGTFGGTSNAIDIQFNDSGTNQLQLNFHGNPSGGTQPLLVMVEYTDVFADH